MADTEQREPDADVAASHARRVWADVRGLVPLLAGTVGALLAWIFGPSSGTRDLYVVAAQVIPVLLLALAFEARVFRAAGTLLPGIESDELLAKAQDLTTRLDTAQRRVEDRARDVVGIEQEISALRHDAQELGRAERKVLYERLAPAEARQAELRRDIRDWVLDIEATRRALKRQMRFLQWEVRTRRVLHVSSWSSHTAHVALGAALLAAGEYEALTRIAEGDYSGEPRFAFAAIGYGFLAILGAALAKR